MVLVHEMRILQPCSVSDFERGLIYGNVKTAEQMEAGGQGSKLLSSSPHYDDVYGEGSFNVSHTCPGERLPAWTSKLISPDQLVMEDKTWIIFPFSRTVVTSPGLAKLKMETLTISLDDNGTTENATRLTKEQLAVRTVEYIDIGSAQVDPKDYRENRDPSLVKSNVTGRGPLTPGWQERERPIMCVYKVVIAEFNYFGVASKVEQLLVSMVRKLTTIAQKTIYCTMDEWFPLTLEQVLDVRDEGKRKQGVSIVEHRRGSKKDLLDSDGAEEEDELDDDVFLDAEMEVALEQQEAGAHLTGLVEPPPPQCPFCVARDDDQTRSPTVYCANCGEFFCDPCMKQVHVTVKMREHKSQPVPVDPKAALFNSVSVAGPMAVKIPEEAVVRRSASRGFGSSGAVATAVPTAASESGSLSGASSGSVAGPFVDFVSAAVTWDKVKDPPLNIFTAERRTPHAAGTRAPWLVLLSGSADKNEDDQFVEVPAALVENPAELSCVMVSVLAALYRSGNHNDPAAAAPASPFPLGQFMPEATSISRNFPALLGPDAAPSAALTAEQLAKCSLSASPYGNGTGIALDYRAATELKSLPGVSSDAGLETQRLQAAQLLRSLAEELLEMDPRKISRMGDAAVAFWVNIHNALLLHAYLVHGIPKSPKDLSMLFQKAAYVVGGVRFSAAGIAQHVLRPAGAGPLHPGLVSGLPLVGRLVSSTSALLSVGLQKFEPLAIFALSLGTFSSPMVRPIHPEGLSDQLERAARGFLEGTVTVKGDKVQLPMLLYSHRFDFGKTRSEQLQAICHLLPPKLAEEVREKAKTVSGSVAEVLNDVSVTSLKVLHGRGLIGKAMTKKLFEAEPDDLRFRYLLPLS